MKSSSALTGFHQAANDDFRNDIMPILRRSVGWGEFEDFRTTTDPEAFLCPQTLVMGEGGSVFEFSLLKMSLFIVNTHGGQRTTF